MFALGSSVGDDVKWKSAIERALGTWESVVEWADYISFLARVQKAVKNKHRCDGSQLPLAANISEMLARCLEPTLPSGVHQMCIDVYDTVFTIIGPKKLALTVNIWLPGLLSVVSWATFNVKPLVVKLFSHQIVPAMPFNSLELRELYKPLFIAMLPSIEEESSDCFVEICELLATLKDKQSDDTHYWQSFYLAVLTSPDCRLGALTLLQRTPPNTSKPGLFIRAVCAGLEDENVLVQRGFLDVLAKLLPLDGKVLESAEEDKPKVMLSSCRTIFRKDMSLNRRLRLWLLGPDPDASADSNGLSRLVYFQKYASQTLIDVLLDNLKTDLVGVCVIARGLMDRWEIGAFVGPALLEPILHKTQEIGHVEPGVEAFFDIVEANVVWNTSIKLLDNNAAEVVLFMVESFNITDEEMVKTYIPLVVVYLLGSDTVNDVELQIAEKMLASLSYRVMPEQPPNLKSKQELRVDIAQFLTSSCEVGINDEESTLVSPFEPSHISWYLLKLSGDLVLNGDSARLLNDVLKLFPPTPGLNLVVPNTPQLIDALKSATSDQIELFKFLMDKMSPGRVRAYVEKLVKNLTDTLTSNGSHQFEKVNQLWELSLIIPHSIVPTALATALADNTTPAFERAKIFADIWMHSIDQTNISAMLTKPVLLFLDLSREDRSIFDAYLQSSVVRTGTSQRMIKLLIDKLDQESRGDIDVFTYVLEKFLVVLSNKDIKAVYVTKFAPLVCTLLLEWFDQAILPDSTYSFTLELAELTILDNRVKDGRVWLRRFVDALTQTYTENVTAPAVIPVSLIKFLAAAVPLLEQIQDVRAFAQLSVSHLQSEVDFEAFSQLLTAISNADPGVEESLLDEITRVLTSVEGPLLKSSPDDIGDSSSVMHLLSGIESILSTGIEYVNSQSDGGNSSGGGLASALAGFQVESPEDRTRAEKARASLDRCIRSAVKQGCKYWLYLQRTREISGTYRRSGDYTSTLHTTGRLKTRLRKLLALCYSSSPSDTLEVVLENLTDIKDVVKMTHMFEGPRFSTTLEMLVKLAHNDSKMFEFAAAYVDSLETDVLGDVWPIMQQFLVSVTSNSSFFYASGDAAKPTQSMILSFLVGTVIPRFEHLRLKNRKKVVRDFSDIYSKLILSNIGNDELIASAVESLPIILPEADRQASLLSRLLSSTFKTAADLAQNPKLLTTTCEVFNIAGSAPTKVWIRYVSDFIFESQSQTTLIPMNVNESIELKPVIKTWVQCDKDKVKEFISKLGTYGSGTGVLFGWTGTQELADSNLKRLAYILICTPPATLAINWSRLMNQLANMWSQSAAISCLLLRACLLSQPTSTMVAFMVFRLQSIFHEAINSAVPITGGHATLLVEACKLLDLALATGIEQFQEFQWLFISDDGDAASADISGTATEPLGKIKVIDEKESGSEPKSPVNSDTTDTKNNAKPDAEGADADPSTHRAGGLLEKLRGSSALPKVPVAEQLTAPDPQFKSLRRPLLPPRATIEDIPIFLSQVTLNSYEEVYAMTVCDREYCESWLLADLFG